MNYPRFGMSLNSTLFAVHWQAQDDEIDSFMKIYSNLTKSIIEYARIVSDLFPTHSFSLSINEKVLLLNEDFRNYQKLTTIFSSFQPSSLVTGSIEQSIFPILSAKTSRLILITNQDGFDWNQLCFDLEFFLLQTGDKKLFLPREVFVIEIGSGVECEYFVLQKNRPCCHGVRCKIELIDDVLRKATILLNDLTLIRIANVPMKKRTDSGKHSYDVLFAMKRDSHITGPTMSDLFVKGWEFFYQYRQFLLAWAKKSSARFSSKKCTHLCTPIDLSDPPSLVVLETVKGGKDEFLLATSPTDTPIHTLSFKNGSLFFNCLHYLEDYLDVAQTTGKSSILQYTPAYSHSLTPLKGWELNGFSEMIQNSNNPKMVLAISEGIKLLNSPTFLTALKLEQKFFHEIKDMLVKVLAVRISEKSQLKALSSLIEYSRNGVASPIFVRTITSEELLLQYLELFEQIYSFYEITKPISTVHATLANEFATKVTQLKTEFAGRKTKSIGYLMLQTNEKII